MDATSTWHPGTQLGFKTPCEAAMGEVDIVRESRRLIESQTISDSRLGALDAARVVVTYRCKGSGERSIQSSVVALSPDKEFLYSLQMYVPADLYRFDQSVLDQLIGSWRFVPESNRRNPARPGRSS